MLAAGQQRVERRLLQRGADRLRDLAGPACTTSKPPTRARAGGRRQERRQHQHRRRLAGAVRAEEAVDLAGLDGEVDPVDRARALRETRGRASRSRSRSSAESRYRCPAAAGPCPARWRSPRPRLLVPGAIATISERWTTTRDPKTSGARARRCSAVANRTRTRRPHWRTQSGSNRRPFGCQPSALPAELWARTARVSLASNS